MKIGIMGAMTEEINLLCSDLKNTKILNIGMRDYLSGELYGKEVVLVFSRWGKVAAAATAATLINKFEVDMLIFTGVAGAISPTLNIGDVVIANELIQYDMDAWPLVPKNEVPLLGVTRFEVRENFINLAEKSAKKYINNLLFQEIDIKILKKFNINSPKVTIGLIGTGDKFFSDSDREIVDKMRLEYTNMQCVEMEGAAVAQVCYEYHFPFIVFRVISDKAGYSENDDFPNFTKLLARYLNKGIIVEFISKFEASFLKNERVNK